MLIKLFVTHGINQMNEEIILDETIDAPIQYATNESGCIVGDVFIALATLVVVIGIIALFKAVAAKSGK